MSTRATTTHPSAPTEPALREAALRHLARYAATEARLLRVLERRVDRWLIKARQAAPDRDDLPQQASRAKQAARRVVQALAASRLVDDAGFAQSRAGMLLRAGKSRAQVARHLALRGIPAEILRATLPADAAGELAAAVLLTRKRRLGAFAPAEAVNDPAARRRALGILARAGFAQDIARTALGLGRDDAEGRIESLRYRGRMIGGP